MHTFTNSGDIISCPNICITTVAILPAAGTGQCEGVCLPHDYNEWPSWVTSGHWLLDGRWHCSLEADTDPAIL